jgi:hypothetical protein
LTSGLVNKEKTTLRKGLSLPNITKLSKKEMDPNSLRPLLDYVLGSQFKPKNCQIQRIQDQMETIAKKKTGNLE